MNDHANKRAEPAVSAPLAQTTTPAQPASTAPSSDASLPTGLWGGPHVRLEVTETGAEIEFDCGHGTLKGPITLVNGRFDVAGTYMREGGPVRRDDKGIPARYKGQVSGSQLTLTFTLDPAAPDSDAFTLVHGQAARLFKCK